MVGIETPSQVPTPLRMRVAVLITVLLPFAGLLAGIALTWPFGFGWLHLGLLLGMYTLTVLGVTVGYHRFFTHRSFATNRVVMSIMGILGSMAVEGPLLTWGATLRCHHQLSDAEADPLLCCFVRDVLKGLHRNGHGGARIAFGLLRVSGRWID